jgi:hypothetical protein
VRHEPGGAKLAAERRKLSFLIENKWPSLKFWIGVPRVCSMFATKQPVCQERQMAAKLSHLPTAKNRFKFGIEVPEKK